MKAHVIITVLFWIMSSLTAAAQKAKLPVVFPFEIGIQIIQSRRGHKYSITFEYAGS